MSLNPNLEDVVDSNVLVRILGDDPPLVVEDGVGLDAGSASDGHVVVLQDRVGAVLLLFRPGQHPV